MFGLNPQKNDFGAVAEWIRKKWEFAHTGPFVWEVKIPGTLFMYERSNFFMQFANNELRYGYKELVLEQANNQRLEKVKQQEFRVDLSKIRQVEATNIASTDTCTWGQPVLQLGVRLIPNYASKAVEYSTIGSVKMYQDGTEEPIRIEAINKLMHPNLAYVYMGNEESLHIRSQKAFDDIIKLCESMPNGHELY